MLFQALAMPTTKEVWLVVFGTLPMATKNCLFFFFLVKRTRTIVIAMVSCVVRYSSGLKK